MKTGTLVIIGVGAAAAYFLFGPKGTVKGISYDSVFTDDKYKSGISSGTGSSNAWDFFGKLADSAQKAYSSHNALEAQKLENRKTTAENKNPESFSGLADTVKGWFA